MHFPAGKAQCIDKNTYLLARELSSWPCERDEPFSCDIPVAVTTTPASAFQQTSCKADPHSTEDSNVIYNA